MAKTPRKPSPSSELASSGAARGTGKALVIVESPAKAKTINKYLGAGYIVRASVGHVRDIPSKGLNVDVNDNFKPTYEITDRAKKVVAELRAAAKNASEVFLATDLDREGEAIAWHLVHALGLDLKTAKRVVFNEITKTAILNAFKSPRLIDENMVNAQQARRIVDRLVGYKISPLLWKKVAGGLSAGRVQSVALKLVVDRELEIQAFIPEEYWKLTGIFTADMTGAPELAQAWRDFLAGDVVEMGLEVKDDGTDSAEAVIAQEASESRTVAEKSAFLSENAAFRAELIEVNGQKFDPKDGATARAAAEAVGLVDITMETIDNDGTNGPRGIPNKGPATKLTRVTGLPDPKRTGVSFSVRELNQKLSTSRPPGPFSTSTLQQAASNSLGFGAQRTMRVAQQLYEGIDIAGIGAVGLITYMRTDSQNISKDAIGAVRGYISESFGDKYLPEAPNFYASKAGAQEAHEAIRPTDVLLAPESIKGRGLSDEQFRLYELIWKRFVACQMTPAQWNVTEAIIDARKAPAATVATFKATGRSMAFDGFTRVAGVYTRFDEQILPPLEPKQPVAPLDLTPTQHFTSPPSRYSEASLVKALEAEGIGRPSTYASIIATIQDRQYVESKGRTLYATDLGIKVTEKLIEGFPDIMETSFTRTIEAELDQVEEATRNWVDVVRDFYTPLERDLATAESRMTHARAELVPSEYKCPDCGAMMAYRLSKRGKRFLSCSRYPDCKGAMNVDREGKPQQLEITEYKCPVCTKPMIKRTGRFGPFLGCSGYPECKTIQAIDKKTGEPLPPKPPPVDTGLVCPKCGKKHIVVRQGKRGPFMSCIGFPKCRTTLPAERLEEFKKSVETTGQWPADILAKFGGPRENAAASAETEKPAKKKAAKKEPKDPAKKPARPRAAKPKTQPLTPNP